MEIIPSVILFAAVSANCMAATVADSTVHNMSVDCDCDSHPADPKLKDMGILASTDPGSRPSLSQPRVQPQGSARRRRETAYRTHQPPTWHIHHRLC